MRPDWYSLRDALKQLFSIKAHPNRADGECIIRGWFEVNTRTLEERVIVTRWIISAQKQYSQLYGKRPRLWFNVGHIATELLAFIVEPEKEFHATDAIHELLQDGDGLTFLLSKSFSP